jgi:site-specific DNA-methyltransferase (adenine-specific)
MNVANEIISLVNHYTDDQSASDVSTYLDRVMLGDCQELMRNMPGECVDFILTDPPYITDYCERGGRKILNDDNSRWILPAFCEAYRVLRRDAFCVSFYGFAHADKFLAAWRECGFRPIGHFSFVKNYRSSVGHTQMWHECAYLLLKGNPPKPSNPPPDVLSWKYSGNKLHPTQKPISALVPLIDAYSKPGDVVLDPFGGSGSTAVAARSRGRHFVLFEVDEAYFQQARVRLLSNKAE